MENTTNSPFGTRRREFVKTTAGGAIAAAFIHTPEKVFAQNSDTLKLGFIGCGGRGTGAASQALTADENMVLTAMADLYPTRLNDSHEILKKKYGERVNVPEDMRFTGFDGFKKVIDSDVDVVLLTTPPSFRPEHFEYAVEKGKHAFLEKPVAIDVPSALKVAKAAKKAKEKNLSVLSGFCWRADLPKRALFQRVLDGEIGEILSIKNTYNTGPVWTRREKEEESWPEIKKQLNSWIYYNWFSGDHIVEQAVHVLDMMSWVMGDTPPEQITGLGGRQQRTGKEFGNVFDHFSCNFEYDSGAQGHHYSRQQRDCSTSYLVEVYGTKGIAKADCTRNRHDITYFDKATKKWRYGRTDPNPNMYQVEHDEFFASIRSGDHINHGDWMVRSTLLAIGGRLATYTGKTLYWDQILDSEENLVIPDISWDTEAPEPVVAIPGVTKFA